MSRSWEHIGHIDYGHVEGDIPRWVLSAEKQIRHKSGGTSSSLLGKYFFLKGRYFKYRLSFAGQGGSLVSVERQEIR